MTTAIIGPHKAIPVSTAREKFCAELFNALWDRYRQRVTYVQTYEKVIRDALKKVRDTLKLRFPVYVAVTMCDLIPGFREYFEGLGNLELQHQILGWSNQESLDVPFDPKRVHSHLSGLVGRLKELRLGLLQDPKPAKADWKRIDEVDQLYVLPQYIEWIVSVLQTYLETIFGPTGPEGLFFRGIYFNSAMRKGEELDAELVKKLNVSFDKLRKGRSWAEDQPYFWRDLMMEKVFKEKDLVTPRQNVTRWLQRWHWALWGSGAFALIVLLILTASQVRSVRKHLYIQSQYWKAAASGWEPNRWRNGTNGSSWHPIVEPGFTGYRGDRRITVDKGDIPFAEFHSTLRQFAATPLATNLFLGSAIRGEREDRLLAQQIVFRASVIDPIVLASRQKMVDDSKTPGSRSLVDPAVLIGAITNLIALEAEIQADRSEPASVLISRLGTLSAYLWDNDTLSNGLGTNLLYCLDGASARNGNGWPDKRVSGGASLRENEAVREGLEVLKERLNDSLKPEPTRGEFSNTLSNLKKLEKKEMELAGNAPHPSKYVLSEYETAATALTNLLARQKRSPDGILSRSPFSLWTAYTNYLDRVNKEYADTFGIIQSRVKALELKESQLPLLRDINTDLDAFQHSLSFDLGRSEIERLDRLLQTTTNQSQHLFEVRRDIYVTLSRTLAFPLLSPSAGAPSPESLPLTAAQVVATRKALDLVSTSLSPAEGPREHRELIRHWQPIYERLKDVAEAMADKEGIRSYKIYLLGDQPDNKKWRGIIWRRARDLQPKSQRTDTGADSLLEDLPLDQGMFVSVTEHTDGQGRACEVDAFTNSWAVPRLLHTPGTYGEGTSWIVNLPAMDNANRKTNAWFKFKFEFKHPIPPPERWPKAEDFTGPDRRTR